MTTATTIAKSKTARGGFVAIILLPVILLFSSLAMLGGVLSQESVRCDTTVGGNAVVNAQQSGSKPRDNQALFQAVLKASKGNWRLAVSMLTAGWLESNWNSTAVGDGSYGVYQIQNPGRYPNPDATVAMAIDPARATNYMLPEFQGALEVVDESLWQSDPALAAATVAYKAERPTESYWESQGRQKVNRAYTDSVQALAKLGLTANNAPVTSDGAGTSVLAEDCEDLTEVMVAAVLDKTFSLIGQKYPVDGAKFVADAYSAGGVQLPATLEEIVDYGGDGASVQAQWIPVAELGKPQRADIMVYGGASATSREDATRLGVYAGKPSQPLRMGSMNVLGSMFTPNTGPRSGVNRIRQSARLIKRQNLAVVGLQELQPDQRAALVRELGVGYGIYPKKPRFRDPGVNSKTSIVWDKSQVKVVEKRAFKNRISYEGPQDFPVLILEDVESGEEFFFANEHYPARPYFAKARTLNAEMTVRDVQTLIRQGKSGVASGDYNSPYGLPKSSANGNPVYQNDPENTAYCTIEKSGVARDTLESVKYPNSDGECTRRMMREMGAGEPEHLFATNDLEVLDHKSIPNPGSDHPLVYAEVAFGETTKESGSVVAPTRSRVVERQSLRRDKLLGVLRITKVSPVSSGVCEPYPAAEAGLTPDAKLVLRYMHGSYPEVETFYGVGSRGNVSDHPSGRAVDAMVPNYETATGRKYGWSIAFDLKQNATELGIDYIIFDAKIWSVARSQEGWRNYGHPNGGEDPTSLHRDHVHVSVKGEAATGGVCGSSTMPGSGEWTLPVEKSAYKLTNTFGLERSYYSSGKHTGLDFAAPTGTPIKAIASGRVIKSEYAGAYGNRVIAKMPDGTEVYYAHLNSFAVKNGDTVQAGETIGSVGSTGNATGPHLHLEIRPKGGDPVDPAPLLGLTP